MAFSNIENSEKLSIINIAIIENNEFKENQIFKNVLDNLSDENNEDRIFNTKYVDENSAKELLENKEITGYLEIQNKNPKITVSSSGINETIFKYVIDEIVQISDIAETKFNEEVKKEFEALNFNLNYEQIYKNIIDNLLSQDIKLNNISNSNLSYTMIEFYTLIAMAALYGGILGMTAINQNLPNMSSKGKRIAISPISKLKLVFSSFCASYLVALIGLLILFVYTIFVLKVDYGNNIFLIILLGMVGSLAGISIGLAIGSTLKTNETTKTGIVISITMIGCFLSGMMGITMKYIIDKNIPIINKINPASMITDGFYSLYYYTTLNRYFFNILSLCVFAATMIIISFISLRRQKYDSI